jgi:hypothetical protein
MAGGDGTSMQQLKASLLVNIAHSQKFHELGNEGRRAGFLRLRGSKRPKPVRSGRRGKSRDWKEPGEGSSPLLRKDSKPVGPKWTAKRTTLLKWSFLLVALNSTGARLS